MAEIDYYGPADEAIRQMDRDNLRAFSKLKLADFDRISIIRTVQNLYETQRRKAKKKYLEIGLEAYLLGLMMTDGGVSDRTARSMAKQAITEEWIDDLLNQTDFVTLYRFSTETERKAQRLIEALALVADENAVRGMIGTPEEVRNMLIDQALKQWTKQLGQYAINVTDTAIMQALDDAGVKGVVWVTERDQRVCADCHQLDGRWFPLDEVPAKPHWNCRCRVRPAMRQEE